MWIGEVGRKWKHHDGQFEVLETLEVYGADHVNGGSIANGGGTRDDTRDWIQRQADW